MFHILIIKLSLANNEIGSFAGVINRARGTCWARACARLTEIPAHISSYLTLLSTSFLCLKFCSGFQHYVYIIAWLHCLLVTAELNSINLSLYTEMTYFKLVHVIYKSNQDSISNCK